MSVTNERDDGRTTWTRAFRNALCPLLALSLLFSGCEIPMGITTALIRTDEQRTPLSEPGPIKAELRGGPGDVATLHLTRLTQEEVKTVEYRQKAIRKLDLTPLILIGLGGFFLLVIIGYIAMGLSGGGGGGGSSDWD